MSSAKKKSCCENISPIKKQRKRKSKPQKINNPVDAVSFGDVLSKLGVPITTFPDGRAVSVCPSCISQEYGDDSVRKAFQDKQYCDSLLSEGYGLDINLSPENSVKCYDFECDMCEFYGNIFAYVVNFFRLQKSLNFEAAVWYAIVWLASNYGVYSLFNVILNIEDESRSDVAVKMADFLNDMAKSMSVDSIDLFGPSLLGELEIYPYV